MLEDLENKKEDKDIILLYSNRDLERIVFKKELERITKTITGLKIVHFLSREESEHSYEKGRITKEMIVKHVPDMNERVFYVVGPPAFVDTMKVILEEINANVIIENFSGY